MNWRWKVASVCRGLSSWCVLAAELHTRNTIIDFHSSVLTFTGEQVIAVSMFNRMQVCYWMFDRDWIMTSALWDTLLKKREFFKLLNVNILKKMGAKIAHSWWWYNFEVLVLNFSFAFLSLNNSPSQHFRGSFRALFINQDFCRKNTYIAYEIWCFVIN